MSDNENTNDAPFSLIKYETQIEISENLEDFHKAKMNQKIMDPKPSAQDVLNNMILPRDWKNTDGKCFMQYVSHQKPSRDDVLRLKDSLDEVLQYRQARNQGICPIREELFSQTLDQIIRQVTINSPERGLLLMRVRDQHKMTLAAYQTLYQSSVSFGMRKMLEAEEGIEDLESQLNSILSEKKKFENLKIQLLYKKQSLEKKIQQRKVIEKQSREQQIKIIHFQAENLDKFLQGLKEIKQQNKN